MMMTVRTVVVVVVAIVVLIVVTIVVVTMVVSFRFTRNLLRERIRCFIGWKRKMVRIALAEVS